MRRAEAETEQLSPPVHALVPCSNDSHPHGIQWRAYALALSTTTHSGDFTLTRVQANNNDRNPGQAAKQEFRTLYQAIGRELAAGKIRVQR